MYKDTPAWLAAELEWGLRETSAPAELWNRIEEARRVAVEPHKRMGIGLVWAMAAAFVLASLVLPIGSHQALALRALSSPSGVAGLHCGNPAELRAWARKSGSVSNSPHDLARGNLSSWAMDNPADLQLACKLCHLD